MSNFTFLTEEQIWGESRLDIIKKRGERAYLTDYSILLGGIGNKRNNFSYVGNYWTQSESITGDRCFVFSNGEKYIVNNAVLAFRNIGARIVFSYGLNDKIPSNTGRYIRGKDGIIEVEYGYYPQQVAPRKIELELENLYNSTGNLLPTGNVYTIDNTEPTDFDKGFSIRMHKEYKYKDKRYVRIKSKLYPSISSVIPQVQLSNGEVYSKDKFVWVEVQPIKWLVDEEAKLMITEKIIFAGIQFQELYKKESFNKSNIKRYIDKYFVSEIIGNRGLGQEIAISNSTDIKENISKNLYDFNFDDVSEEDIIRGAVKSGVAVFLHGRSSEGKSSRVKQIDPDCEIIYLRNATPESLNGRCVYNQATGEMIDVKPTWLQKLEAKCEEEKDELHVLFFDEMTNALPSIQGMAFNIVLDREVNGKWKLPKNARIVAAGNDLDDSLAANELAEPLFNRFAHVYIETTVESWLKWAASPEESYKRLDYEEEKSDIKIHPSICEYIEYKGESALRTEYNGKTPNADPRKWEMASKVLYATKQPEMLRALVGEVLTRDFVEFCKHRVISVDEEVDLEIVR